MIQRKKNVAGYVDEQGRFRPIRSPRYVGTPNRKAKASDRRKYSRAKAGDLGKRRQMFALEDVFDREIRKQHEAEEKLKQFRDKELREAQRDAFGTRSSGRLSQTLAQFVRSAGGIRRTYRFGGRKGHSGKSSWDAGEIDRLSYKATGRRGLTTDKGGNTIDGMFKAVRQAGYDVSSPDEMMSAIEDEAAGGSPIYPTHGYLDYRENPTRNGVLVGDTNGKKMRSDLYIAQLGRTRFGVFLKTYLLKAFKTKAAAQSYIASIRKRSKKNPPSASKLAKAAISVFDNDLDLDVDVKDISRLRAGEKKLRRRKSNAAVSTKRPARKNPSEVARTILTQLGGNRFVAMTGAKSFRATPTSLDFRLPSNPHFTKGGINFVQVVLTPQDLYDVEYGKLRGSKYTVVRVSKGIFADMLRTDFTRTTGLDTSLDKVKANPLDPLGAFANAAVGIASALQIKEYMNRPTRKPSKSRGKTPAKSNKRAKNPVSETVKQHEKEFDRLLALIEEGKLAVIRSAKLKGRLAGYSPREVDQLIYRSRIASVLKRNPKGKRHTAKKNPVSGFLVTAKFPREKPASFYYRDRVAAINMAKDFKAAKATATVMDLAERKVIFTTATKRKPNTSRKASPVGKKAATRSGNPLKVTLFKFYPGQLLKTRSLTDHDVIYRAEVISRTAKFVTFQEDGLKHKRAKIYRSGNSEYFYPDGQYSMAASFYARPDKNNENPKATAATKYPYRVIGGTNRTVASFPTLKQAKEYARLHPAFRVVKGNPSRRAKQNPVKKIPHRRTFSMFQGRPATKVNALSVSRHAPSRLDQLGDLIELKLVGGQVIKLNPKRFKLCSARGRLWIAGGTFAKANPTEKANVLNPIAEIAHVVYGTHKPHHGDHAYTHYIHKLGEESGKRPILAVDREGFPVIRGGNYTIEARGIVD